MNAPLDLYINAEQEQNVSIVSRDMHVNARQDTRETVDMVVSKARLKLVVAQISIVPIMPNVTKDHVPVEKGLKQLERSVLILTNANDKRIFVAQALPVPTK
jgi:hypothetical protein